MLAFVCLICEPELSPAAGEYIEAFDPRGSLSGTGLLVTTVDENRAKRFDSIEQAERFLDTETPCGEKTLRGFGIAILPVTFVSIN